MRGLGVRLVCVTIIVLAFMLVRAYTRPGRPLHGSVFRPWIMALVGWGTLLWLYVLVAWPARSGPPWFQYLVVVPGTLLGLTVTVLGVLGGLWYFGHRLVPAVRMGAVDPGRRKFLRWAGIAVPAGVFTGAVTTIVIALNRVVVRRVEVPAPAPELRGTKILQLTDLHVGAFLQPEHVRELAPTMQALEPDVLVLTGDLVDIDAGLLGPTLAALEAVRPRHGTFACLGNHERYADEGRCIAAYRESAATLLVDQARVLELENGARIALAGVAFPRRHDDAGTRVATALRGLAADIPKLLLAHHPHDFDAAREQGVFLTLSGHTHGGQLSLGRIGGRVLSVASLMFKYVYGLYVRSVAASGVPAHLYVSGGLGHWLPTRFGIAPEITLVTLV